MEQGLSHTCRDLGSSRESYGRHVVVLPENERPDTSAMAEVIPQLDLAHVLFVCLFSSEFCYVFHFLGQKTTTYFIVGNAHSG